MKPAKKRKKTRRLRKRNTALAHLSANEEADALVQKMRLDLFKHGWAKKGKDGQIAFAGDLNIDERLLQLVLTFGLKPDDIHLANGLWVQALRVAGNESATKQDFDQTLSAIKAINPKGAIEAMLAVQMAGMHNLAVEFIRRAARTDQTIDSASRNVELANKCSRTLAVLAETLNRLRGKGPHRVVVEHVTVNSGGQAIVGAVATTPKGEGGAS